MFLLLILLLLVLLLSTLLLLFHLQNPWLLCLHLQKWKSENFKYFVLLSILVKMLICQYSNSRKDRYRCWSSEGTMYFLISSKWHGFFELYFTRRDVFQKYLSFLKKFNLRHHKNQFQEQQDVTRINSYSTFHKAAGSRFPSVQEFAWYYSIGTEHSREWREWPETVKMAALWNVL